MLTALGWHVGTLMPLFTQDSRKAQSRGQPFPGSGGSEEGSALPGVRVSEEGWLCLWSRCSGRVSCVGGQGAQGRIGCLGLGCPGEHQLCLGVRVLRGGSVVLGSGCSGESGLCF